MSTFSSGNAAVISQQASIPSFPSIIEKLGRRRPDGQSNRRTARLATPQPCAAFWRRSHHRVRDRRRGHRPSLRAGQRPPHQLLRKLVRRRPRGTKTTRHRNLPPQAADVGQRVTALQVATADSALNLDVVLHHPRSQQFRTERPQGTKATTGRILSKLCHRQNRSFPPPPCTQPRPEGPPAASRRRETPLPRRQTLLRRHCGNLSLPTGIADELPRPALHRNPVPTDVRSPGPAALRLP